MRAAQKTGPDATDSLVLNLSSTQEKLRPRDSNPDYLVQSEACCHYTRAQRGYGG